jgi:hypothetical protein
MVWSGAGATDGIDPSINLFLHDLDQDIRAEAALAVYEAGRNTPRKQPDFNTEAKVGATMYLQ